MNKYKITTSWTGYSEIEVEAKSEKEAKEIVDMGNYDPNNEVLTGYGLDYGYENEEIIKVNEIKENEDE